MGLNPESTSLLLMTSGVSEVISTMKLGKHQLQAEVRCQVTQYFYKVEALKAQPVLLVAFRDPWSAS